MTEASKIVCSRVLLVKRQYRLEKPSQSKTTLKVPKAAACLVTFDKRLLKAAASFKEQEIDESLEDAAEKKVI